MCKKPGLVWEKVNFLPNKFLALAKVKAFADYRFFVAKMLTSTSRVEYISNMFSKGFL